MQLARLLGLRLTQLMALVALLEGLVGCATPGKPLTKDAAAQVHKIAVLEVQDPLNYGATNMYLEGVFLGGVVNLQHTNQFTKVLHDHGFHLADEMTRCLVAELTAAGFEVEQIQAERKLPMQAGVASHGKTN